MPLWAARPPEETSGDLFLLRRAGMVGKGVTVRPIAARRGGLDRTRRRPGAGAPGAVLTGVMPDRRQMRRANYTQGKRQREDSKARKREAKADRRAIKRDSGPAQDEIVSAEEMTGSLPTVAEAMAAIEAPVPASRRASSFPIRLFVGGLSFDTTSSDLQAHFEACGEVLEAIVVSDRDTGRSRGFGFVTMADRRAAAAAIEQFDGAELGGRRIAVNPASERTR